MKFSITLPLIAMALTLGACAKKEDPSDAADWHPQDASVARHISSVHGFMITGDEGAHLKVSKEERKITCEFREDVLKDLGGEKALFVFSWETNPQEISKAEYLYFLEALHAYLVINAPKWDGGEGKS
ncbi:MAG: hypothetical protein P1U68_14130 [Verrucomicrobiales bacterium]|nr:hypothetical protein [Verrucomicrobiales bacterium]